MSTSDLQELPIDRRIREALAERMEHGATGELDLRLAAITGKWKRSERAGWHS